MKIGIDIDGVLVDMSTYLLNRGSKYFYDKYKIGISDPNGYEVKDIFKVNDEKANEFWQEIIYEYGVTYQARTYASEVIKKLKANGNQIIILTARGGLNHPCTIEHKKMHNLIKKWLKKNNIVYDELYFTDEDKVSFCQKIKIDLMIEDKPRNVEQIANVIPVLCYDAPYNKHLSANNISRVYSWYDIYNKINSISK